MEKNSTFANEPTALANDIGKDIPILKGEDAERFIKEIEKVEKELKNK